MSTLSKRAWALDLLGLDANATVDEIKTAYRDLVLIWHPDKHQSNARNLKRAEEMIKRLNAARDVLIDNGDIPSDWVTEQVGKKNEEPVWNENSQAKQNKQDQYEETAWVETDETYVDDKEQTDAKGANIVHEKLKNLLQAVYEVSLNTILSVMIFCGPLLILNAIDGCSATKRNQKSLTTSKVFQQPGVTENWIENNPVQHIEIETEYGQYRYLPSLDEWYQWKKGSQAEQLAIRRLIMERARIEANDAEKTPQKIYIAQARYKTPIYASPSLSSKLYYTAEQYQYLYGVAYSEFFVKIKMSNNVYGYARTNCIAFLKEVSREDIEKSKLQNGNQP